MPKLGMEPIRRDQICRGAAEVIVRHGFRGATLQQVAQAAGVSAGMIHHYYPNKLALLIEALVFVSEGFQSRTRRAVTEAADGRAKLRAVIRFGIEQKSDEEQQGHKIWLLALAEGLTSPELAAVIHERRQLFHGLLSEVIRALDLPGALDDAAVASLAEEFDAYLNGLAAMHFVTGQLTLDASTIERSLLALAESRCAAAGKATHPPATAARARR